jgi:hypothetical protein
LDETSLIGIEFTFEETKSRLNLQNDFTFEESKSRHNVDNEFSFEEENKSRLNFEDEQTMFVDELIARDRQKQKFEEKTENNYQCFIKSR